jgi:hypothetical protein
MSWFSKTTVFRYADLRDDVKAIVHLKIDKSIEYLYQSSPYYFQIYVGNTVLLTRDSYVKSIPKEVYFDSVARVLGSTPFIIHPNGDDYYFTVSVVQNFTETATTPTRISERLARAAVQQAQTANENCAITLEPLRSLTSFAVSPCGHVFSEAALRLHACPLCKAPAVWTACSSL